MKKITVQQISHFFILLVITIKEILSERDIVCKSINSTKYEITWPSTRYRTQSKPPCLNERNEFVYRRCLDGKWDVEPNCSSVQAAILPECPGEFTDAGAFCYVVSKEVCPFNDVIPFYFYEHIISQQNVGPVLMPLERNDLGVFQWTEKSRLYKSIFNKTYFDTDDPYHDRCLLYYNSSYIATASCEQPHSRICAYTKLTNSSNQLCGKESCFESDFMSRTKCFCLQNPEEFQHPKAEFLDIYQNIVYEKLTNTSCTFGLEKTSEGTYIWSNSKTKVNYTFWSSTAVFQEVFTYGAVTPKGWILTKSELSCSFIEKQIDEVKPTLELTLDPSVGNFTLIATGIRNLKKHRSKILLYCFTDAHPTKLIYRISPEITYETEDITIFGFQALEFGPGSYWCEGFTYSNLTLIQTEVIFYREKDYIEFVGMFILDFSSRYLSAPEKLLHSGPLRSLYVSRIMQVTNVGLDQRHLLVNAHFTSLGTSISDEEAYEEEYAVAKQLLEDKHLDLINFLSSDFCIAVNEGLTWPTTKVGYNTTSVEFCFLLNGSRPVRYCEGSFMEGAKWSSAGFTCQTPDQSSWSESLISLFDYPSLEAVTTVCDISSKFKEMNSFDVYLISKLFQTFAPSELYLNTAKLEEVFVTLDNLLNIDKNVLREAQEKMKATDSILQFVDAFICFKEAPNFDSTTYNNYALISSTSRNISGIIVQKHSNGKYIVSLMEEDFKLEQASKVEHLVCLLWISPRLRLQLSENDKISILLYYNNGFFTETITNVFSLQFSSKIEWFEGPIKILHKVDPNEFVDIYCVYWNFGSILKGYWNRDNKVEMTENLHLCEFWHTGNLGLIGTRKNEIAYNVTMELTDILYNNYTVAVTMSKLQNISECHEEFGTDDVFLYGQILKKVALTSKEVNLHVLAQAVSNCLKISPNILQESQIKTKATDVILENIDTIAQNSVEQFGSFGNVAENFLIYRIDTKKTNFTSLVVFSDGRNPELLKGEVDTDIVLADNVKGAMVLSPELKTQLWKNPNIVITVFFKNIFFFNNLTADLVFGVVLPEIGEFLGPVSTYHRMSDLNDTPMCVHWFYNSSKNITGFWKNDSLGQIICNSVRCEYWHTTHLGLLFLEEDKYEDEYNVMAWANIIGSLLSLFGFLGIILTAILFKKWRNNKGNQILLNFVVSIILPVILYIIATQTEILVDYPGFCTVVGAFLHYFTLSQFSWMLIIGILQLKRFVVVFVSTPQYLVLKACLLGWGLPFPFVLYVLSSPDTTYINEHLQMCYPSGMGLYLGIWLPAGIILSFNLGAFVYILYSICDRKFECGVISGSEILHQRRIAVLLFFLLGITWIFGLLANFDFGVVFIYLFNFTASFQCFIIFLYFIVLNKTTRDMYVNEFKKCYRKNY